MKNTIVALAAAAAVAAALPSPAHANCNGCGVAAGVIGGIAAGAIVGSAIANSRPMPNRLTSLAAFATSKDGRCGLKVMATGGGASRCAIKFR
jgi:hypothetical protein